MAVSLKASAGGGGDCRGKYTFLLPSFSIVGGLSLVVSGHLVGHSWRVCRCSLCRFCVGSFEYQEYQVTPGYSLSLPLWFVSSVDFKRQLPLYISMGGRGMREWIKCSSAVQDDDWSRNLSMARRGHEQVPLALQPTWIRGLMLVNMGHDLSFQICDFREMRDFLTGNGRGMIITRSPRFPPGDRKVKWFFLAFTPCMTKTWSHHIPKSLGLPV